MQARRFLSGKPKIMKSGFSKSLSSDDDAPATLKSTPKLSTITLRFVTLLVGTVVLLTLAWSR